MVGYLTYGVIGGGATGMMYVVPGATASKWFPEERGLANGISLAGFGLGALVFNLILGAFPEVRAMSDSTSHFIALRDAAIAAGHAVAMSHAERHGDIVIVRDILLWSGLAYLVIGTVSALILHLPPATYSVPKAAEKLARERDFTPGEMLRTPAFYLVWLMLLINSLCGLALFSNAVPIYARVAGITAAAATLTFGLVSSANGIGRLLWAWLSDFFGRMPSIAICFALEGGAFLLLANAHGPLFTGVCFALALLCFGGIFAIAPAVMADFYGTKFFGEDYSFIITSTSVGGLVGPLLVAGLEDAFGTLTAWLPRARYRADRQRSHPFHHPKPGVDVTSTSSPRAYICDAVRTPFGRYGGALATVRTDDLAAIPIAALVSRNPKVDWAAVDDVVYGCANQAGEDNRNVARMAALLAGLPVDVAGTTTNRLCGSGLDALAAVARAIVAGEIDLAIAGGVESMTRAPFVVPKADAAFSRTAHIFDTTIGWRFVNHRMREMYGVDSMPETAENVSGDFGVARADQDAFALRSQQRAAAAQRSGRFADEIVPVTVPRKKGDALVVSIDEQPRPDTTLEAPRKAEGHRASRRQRHRRELVRRERRRVRAARRLGIRGRALWAHSHGAHRRNRSRRRAAAHHGHRARARNEKAVIAAPDEPRRHERHRTQRGVRRAVAGGAAGARARRRRGARESERRRDRARTSAGSERRAACNDRRVRTAAQRRTLRALHDVHRRRARDSHGYRTSAKTCEGARCNGANPAHTIAKRIASNGATPNRKS